MAENDFYQIYHRNKSTAQTVTMKSEEKSIADGGYISPPGHLSTIKNVQKIENKISFNLVSMSGVRMEDGRTWSNSSKIFSRKIILKNDGFETELKVLNSFEVTSSNKKTAKFKGGVISQLTNPAYVDLEPPESANLHLVIFGGQAVDKYTTSDDLIIIKGPADFSGAVDVTVWTSTFMTYSQFKIPQGWSDGSYMVQRGQVPMSRSGATMGVLSNKSSHPGQSSHIILVGGFHLPKPGPLKKQVSDSNILILKYPDMGWKKLPFQENMVWKKLPFQKKYAK